MFDDGALCQMRRPSPVFCWLRQYGSANRSHASAIWFARLPANNTHLRCGEDCVNRRFAALAASQAPATFPDLTCCLPIFTLTSVVATALPELLGGGLTVVLHFDGTDTPVYASLIHNSTATLQLKGACSRGIS